ncbi:ABC transporter substrate-binding protein [bacterium]|nr:MAG: ABC transporter substrate-binding protein [bacterium]
MKNLSSLFPFFLVLLLLAASPLQAQSQRFPVAYSAISATQTGLYITKEAGLFEKHGLNVDLIYIGSGTRVAQAVIAGEFPIALAGGTIVNANLAGGDITIVGGIVNVPAFYLIVHPSIKKPEDLKGKALGITRYGSSTDFTLRYLIKKWGMDPDRDVKILQMGGQPEILAGVQAGVIQGGNFSSPADYKAREAGYTVLADFAKTGLDYPTVSIVSTRSYIKKDSATVKRFLMAYSEGVQKLFKDKDYAMKIIGKYTRTQDHEVLEASYTYATNFIERTPRLPYKAIETVLAQTAERDPKAKEHKAEDFIDATFFNELEKSGFFKSLGW